MRMDLSVMIVEDEAILRSTMEKIIRRQVREVHTFENPSQALEAFETIRPDVILSDIKMPGMDGLEMVERIRKMDENVPVIIASAFSDAVFFQRAIRLNVRHFLVKPIDVEELIGELERIDDERSALLQYRLQAKLLDEYKRIVDTSNLVSKSDINGKITYVNDKFIKSSGYTKEELVGRSHSVVRHPDMPDAFFTTLWKSILSKEIWQGTIKNKNKNGKAYYVETTIAPILNQADEIVEFISVRTDVTKLVEALRDAQRLEKEKKDYLELIDENIISSSTNLNGTITSVSNAFCRISQYSREELIGQSHRIVKHPEMPDRLYEEMWDALSGDRSWEGEIKNRAKDGSSYWVYATISPMRDDSGKKIGYTAIRQNITDKKRVEELSVTDRLTGLFNRTRLDEVLAYEIPQSKRYKIPLSIIMVDMDHFKSVNDVYGHLAGDRVLQELSRILQETGREADTVGRWGGEEFLIILPKTDLQGARGRAEKIRRAIEGHHFTAVGSKTASLGISELCESDTMESFIDRADQALYRAKTGGRNRIGE